MKDKRSSCQYEKHNVTFETECWKKVDRLAKENGLTISAVVNGIIHSVSDFKCQMSVGFANEGNADADGKSDI